MHGRYIFRSRCLMPCQNQSTAESRYALQDAIETPAASCLPQIDAIWGSVISMVKTDMLPSAGGIIGALLAALPGLVDLLSLPEGPRATAIKHMALNLTIVALYVINFAMRWKEPANPGGLVWLSLISLVLLVISGWLGGKMVYEYGVAVATTTEPPRR